MKHTLLVLVGALALSSCSGEDSSAATLETQRFPDVVAVEVVETSDDVYRFEVTISSPYDTPERYADAWRVKGEDGAVYGVRELLHDHQTEQPFTRTLDDVEIPEGTASVIVEGRDLEHGWGGDTLIVDLP